MFVAVFVEYGILGLIALLVLLLRLVFIASKGTRPMVFLLWFLIGWLVAFSFASHNLFGHSATLPLLGFAIARAYQVSSSRTRGLTTS